MENQLSEKLNQPTADRILTYLMQKKGWVAGPIIIDDLSITYPQLRMALKDVALVGRVDSQYMNGHRAFRVKTARPERPAKERQSFKDRGILMPLPTPAEEKRPTAPASTGASDALVAYLKGRDWTPRQALLEALAMSEATFRGAISNPVKFGQLEKRQGPAGKEYLFVSDEPRQRKPAAARTEAPAPAAPAKTVPKAALRIKNPPPHAHPRPAALPPQNPVYLQPEEAFKAWADFDGNLLLAFDDGKVHMLTLEHMRKLKNLMTTAEMLRDTL